MTGKTNYTTYVQLGSNFSITATYACTPPEEVESVTWTLTNYSLAIVFFIFGDTLPLYFGHTDLKIIGNTSMCTLTVRNATLRYNDTIFAIIRERGRNTTVRIMHPKNLLTVKVIVTGIY
jgi:hypothetical protein